MDVDVDEVQRHLQEDEGGAAELAGARAAIGLGHRLRHRAIAHGTSVDEQPQVRARRPGTVGPGHEAAHDDPVRAALHRQEAVERAAAEELVDARGEAVDRRGLDERAAPGGQDEARTGTGEGEQRERLRDVAGFRGLDAQELPPRGHRPEEVAHLHRRPAGMAHVAGMDAAAVMDLHLGAARRRLLAGAQPELGDAGDGGKGLPPEAVGGDRVQIGQRAQLGGGVALERAPGVLGPHAFAVVADADELLASGFDLHRHRGRTRVERVLDQLLHDRRRPLHHLARRDLVDEVLGELLDHRHRGRGLTAGSRGGRSSPPRGRDPRGARRSSPLCRAGSAGAKARRRCDAPGREPQGTAPSGSR